MKRVGPGSATSSDLWSATPRPTVQPSPRKTDSESAPTLRIALVHDQIYPFFKGGVEKRLSDYAMELERRGHEVHLIGTKRWDGPDVFVENGIIYSGIRSGANPHNRDGRRSIWQAIQFAYGLARRIRTETYDVIDLQSTAPLACLFGLIVARRRHIPTVVTWIELWGPYWREYLGPVGVIGQFVDWLVSKLADSNATISHQTRARMEARGIEADAFLPCGLDIERFQAVPESDASSDIMCVSRLVRHKNIEFLIDALSVLRDKGVKPHTLIVGDGPEHDVLVEKAQSAGLDNVAFRTDVDSEEELIGMLKASKIFALPSIREGFGLAVVEAAACGLPTVLLEHRDNAASELVHPDLVVTSTPEAFAAKLGQLLDDADFYAKMAKHAADSVRVHSLRPIVDEAEKFYATILHSDR